MAKSNKSSSGKGGGSYTTNSNRKGGGNRPRHTNPKSREHYGNENNDPGHYSDHNYHEEQSSYSKRGNAGTDDYYNDSSASNSSKEGEYQDGNFDRNTEDYPSKGNPNSHNDYYRDARDYGSSKNTEYGNDRMDNSNRSVSNPENKYNESDSETGFTGRDQRDSYGNNDGSSKYRSNNYDDHDDYNDYHGIDDNTGDSPTNNSSGKQTYRDNEPINDPPYDHYNEPIGKQTNGGQEDNPNNDGNGSPEADMVFTEEEVYGNGNLTEEGNSDNLSRGDIFERFVRRYGHLRFRNSMEINQFFSDHSDQSDFLSWFALNIGGRGAWRHRRFGNLSSQNRLRFDLVWDNIPMLYTGDNREHAINIFQFFGLVSIMINEVGQTFTPIRERGSLSYMFGTVIPASSSRPERRKRSYNDFGRGPRNRNNKTAYELFNDANFLSAHRDEALYDRLANTDNRRWDGHVYPSGFPTRPSEGGIIAQADFYKFSGRGLVQTTWSGAYMRLINATLQYSGRNPIISRFRNEWRRKQSDGLSIRDIASQTKNSDWDRLFMETNNEFACLAIYVFQNAKNNFLQIPSNPQRLRSTQTGSQGSGSLFYVGYRVGGSARYGNTVRDRVVQMMETILRDENQ